MAVTEAALRALEIVHRRPGIRPAEFAKEMWPASESWARYSDVGQNGVVSGIGIVRAGGAYLGKLKRQGLVRERTRRVLRIRAGATVLGDGWEITAAGCVESGLAQRG